MLVDYAGTDMGCFDDYLDAAPRAKNMRGNGITKFLLHVAQYITFHQTNIFYRSTYCLVIVEVILFKFMFQGY